MGSFQGVWATATTYVFAAFAALSLLGGLLLLALRSLYRLARRVR